MAIEAIIEVIAEPFIMLAKIAGNILRQEIIQEISATVGSIYKYFHQFNNQRFNWIIVTCYLLIWALAGTACGVFFLILYNYLPVSNPLLVSSLVGLFFGIFEYCLAFYYHHYRLPSPKPSFPPRHYKYQHRNKNRKWRQTFSGLKSS